MISPSKTECLVVDGRARLSEASRDRAARCQHCGSLDGASVQMLVCDCCNEGWHTQCLQEPLEAVPEGDWFCPKCAKAADISGGRKNISGEAPVRIIVGGKELERVESFKYRGSQFDKAGSLDTELKRRTQQAVAGFQLAG